MHYWLSKVAQRTRVAALVVGDASGLLIAGSLKGPEADELAAVAPLLMREGNDGQNLAQRHRLPMAIERVDVDGTDLLLCAVGDHARCQAGLAEAQSGVTRILA